MEFIKKPRGKMFAILAAISMLLNIVSLPIRGPLLGYNPWSVGNVLSTLVSMLMKACVFLAFVMDFQKKRAAAVLCASIALADCLVSSIRQIAQLASLGGITTLLLMEESSLVIIRLLIVFYVLTKQQKTKTKPIWFLLALILYLISTGLNTISCLSISQINAAYCAWGIGSSMLSWLFIPMGFYANQTVKTISSAEKVSYVNSADTLEKIAKLHEQGILTDEEFQQKKTDILAKM